KSYILIKKLLYITIKNIINTSTASMPNWLKWGFWLSPLSYAEIGLTGNEFLAPRWLKVIFT
ncbi:Os12g0239950, partial [Oryza sativa Japonica Group]